MNQRLFSALLVIGLAATSAHAQAPLPAPERRAPAPLPPRSEPVPAPSEPAPGSPAPAVGAAATGAPRAEAPTATPANGSAAATSAVAGPPSEGASKAPRTALESVAPLPPPGTVYAAPPFPGGYVAPPAPTRQPQVRLASPRLYAIEPRKPRRYGHAGAPFAVGIGGGVIYRDDIGYELLSKSKGSAGLELFASYDIWAPSTLLVLSAGLDFRSEVHEAAEDIGVAHHTVQAELSARLLATRWLWPHLRLAAGVVTTGFDAEDQLGSIAYEDRDLGFAGTLGAGFTLRTPARTFETHNGRLSSLSLGVQVEGGYTLANPASLRAKPTGTSELARVDFPAGKLDRAGPYFRVMFVVRF